MPLTIQIKNQSSTPKYEQLIQEFLRLIRTKKLKLGDKIPSLNEICEAHSISRDTVVTAYNELKNRGIISSRHGKGFYVSSTSIKSKLKIFLLFDVMNSYKEVLYQSIVSNLGTGYHVDIFFHYYNIEIFEQLIHNHLNSYGYFVIMPHFNEDVSVYIKQIPKDKLLIIDKDLLSAKFEYNAVFQNFESDVNQIFKNALPLFAKYNAIKFVANHNFQFVPAGIQKGFKSFCKEHKINGKILDKLNLEVAERGDAFLIMSDADLIALIKFCKLNKYKLGIDIGIISYDETPLKEVLANGITVISTDFIGMGAMASDIVKGKIHGKFENKALFIKRNSL